MGGSSTVTEQALAAAVARATRLDAHREELNAMLSLVEAQRDHLHAEYRILEALLLSTMTTLRELTNELREANQHNQADTTAALYRAIAAQINASEERAHDIP